VWAARQPGYYIHENASSSPHAENFLRRRGRLWDLVRRRYFEVSVRPIAEVVVFEAGWYEEEGAGAIAWRWMAARSRALLPPIAGEARLTLSLYIPLDALPAPPNITVRVNGIVVDRFRPVSNAVEREVVMRARGDAINELLIETDRVVAPAAQYLGTDVRTLGLRLNSLGWMPAGT
jgi:hypothetical protein